MPTALTPVTPVADLDRAPLHGITHLTVNRGWRGTNVSSGILLSPAHLLTAAHNVYSLIPSIVRSGNVRGAVGSSREWSLEAAFGRAEAAVAEGYRWFRYPRDYAVVTLRAPAPASSPFTLPADGETIVAPGQTVHVAGFPGADGFESGRLYGAQGVVRSFDAHTFHYAVDTGKGMSGCPVWIERLHGSGSAFVLAGVHVGFTQGAALARRLDEPEALRAIRAWMADSPA